MGLTAQIWANALFLLQRKPRLLSICFGFLLTLLALAPSGQAKAIQAQILRFPTYDTYKQKILELIGNAHRSIWLASEAMTDGDFSSALYMAKYRQVQVYVLLAQEALASDSQYGQLKQYKVPVSLTKKSFFQSFPSQMQVDGKFYTFNTSFRKGLRLDSYLVQRGGESYLKHFIKNFREHFLANYQTASSDLLDHPRQKEQKLSQPKKAPAWSGHEAYRYQRKYKGRPKDVANSLPKIPKWKKQN